MPLNINSNVAALGGAALRRADPRAALREAGAAMEATAEVGEPSPLSVDVSPAAALELARRDLFGFVDRVAAEIVTGQWDIPSALLALTLLWVWSFAVSAATRALGWGAPAVAMIAAVISFVGAIIWARFGV